MVYSVTQLPRGVRCPRKLACFKAREDRSQGSVLLCNNRVGFNVEEPDVPYVLTTDETRSLTLFQQ